MAQTFQTFNKDGITDIKISNYQPIDCNNVPIGTPLDVIPIISLGNSTVNVCNSAAIYTPIVNAIIGSVQQDKELIYTPVTKFHIGSTNYYYREKITYDSRSGVEVSRFPEYSTDGTIFVPSAPGGTLEIGWFNTPEIQYNINETQIANNSNIVNLDPNTYHSVSVQILVGSALITEGAISYTVTAGYSRSWEASSYLINGISVSGLPIGSTAIVSTIR